VLASCLGLLAGSGGASGTGAAPDREAAYRANNLGVALLEQYRFADAVEAFKKARTLDPGLRMVQINLAIGLYYLPDLAAARKEADAAAAASTDALQPPYVLGLIARQENRPEDALAAFERVQKADPGDTGANVNYGQVLLQQRRYEEAIRVLEKAVAAEPYNITATYNLGVALTRSGRRDEGAAVTQKFQVLRESLYKTSFGQNYLEQGRYAEAVSSTGAEPELVDPKTPDVSFTEATAGALTTPAPGGGTTGAPVRIALLDTDGDGALDLFELGPAGARLLHNDGGRFSDVTAKSGLAGVTGVAAVGGDYDRDGRADLLVLRPEGLRLFHNEGDGRFMDATASAKIPPFPNAATSVAFVDVDHDGDLDVFVGGYGAGAAAGNAANLLLRNNGDGTFTDTTGEAKVAATGGRAVAIVPTDFDNRRDIDLLVVNEDGAPALLKNMRDGSFADVAGAVGLPKGGRFRAVAAADVNKDGFTDFFFASASGPGLLAASDGKGGFVVTPAPAETAGATAAQIVDYDNDGLLDLLVAGADGLHLLRNTGRGFADATAKAFPRPPRTAGEGTSLAVADLDGDGDEDVLLASGDTVTLLRNDGGNRNRSLPVRLTGRVSNLGGVGAKVEVRAGSLRQKLETYATAPAVAPADVVFGLGPRPGADALRVVWASGIVQTETELPSAAAAGARVVAMAVTELDRKPSSCPFLYAWDGTAFRFVTDFLGAGEMGYWLAPGERNEPDPVEYVRLRGDQLRPRDGRYELRVTNELEEVLFLDRFRLLAVAHPRDVEVFPNEGMTHHPRPFRLFGARNLRPPVSAREDDGRDVRDRIATVDRTWPDGFRLRPIRGYAEPHGLSLDLGPGSDRALLLLTAWTDYAFSSDNVAASQRGWALEPPELQVRNANGEWEDALEVGIPVGRPQTIVLDLSGAWKGPRREVRIVTNMRVYWDQVQVADPADASAFTTAALDPVRADLRERGFSAEVSPDGREPQGYDYRKVSCTSPWKVMPGRYTRPGDVRELLAASDDLFVVSRPGDEVALSFDAGRLPPLPAGWARTFLLMGDGFSKEMDINSASPDVVSPLPYHGMAAYPYAASEPPEALRRQAERQLRYDTRVVVRPLTPLDLARWSPGGDVTPGPSNPPGDQ
jgi:Flp pilus assembly protein TadD